MTYADQVFGEAKTHADSGDTYKKALTTVVGAGEGTPAQTGSALKAIRNARVSQLIAEREAQNLGYVAVMREVMKEAQLAGVDAGIFSDWVPAQLKAGVKPSVVRDQALEQIKRAESRRKDVEEQQAKLESKQRDEMIDYGKDMRGRLEKRVQASADAATKRDEEQKTLADQARTTRQFSQQLVSQYGADTVQKHMPSSIVADYVKKGKTYDDVRQELEKSAGLDKKDQQSPQEKGAAKAETAIGERQRNSQDPVLRQRAVALAKTRLKKLVYDYRQQLVDSQMMRLSDEPSMTEDQIDQKVREYYDQMKDGVLATVERDLDFSFSESDAFFRGSQE